MTNSVLTSRFDPEKCLEDVSSLTLPEYLLENTAKVAANGNRSMIVNAISGENHLYANFENFTRRIGSYLFKRGMRKGDTLVFLTQNMLHVPAVLCAVWRANGIARASYAEDDKEILMERVEESVAGWLLCDPESSGACLWVASQVSWPVEVIVIGEAEGCTSWQDVCADDGLTLPTLEIKSDDPAIIFCTSGTTGKSKGAVHTHYSLLNILEGMKCFPFTTEKPNLILAKGTHLSGCVFPLRCFTTGKTALIVPKVNKENVLKAVEKFQPGFIWGFAPFLVLLVNDPESSKYDLSSLEFAVSGGAHISSAMEKALMQLPNLKAVINSYGLTEVFPICSEVDFEKPSYAKIEGVTTSSIGRVFPGVSLKIRDPDSGESLGPNKRGEICVKSQGLFRSYYKNPEATENTFVDGWFLTGDLGYYDDDQTVYLVDRMKEIFKYCGNHVSPVELENLIGKYPEVAEVCVAGVPDPNGGDHIPRAFVTMKTTIPEEQRQELGRKIQSFANGQLAEYKHIRGGVHIVANLPKGKTGKVSRQLVAQMPVHDHEHQTKNKEA